MARIAQIISTASRSAPDWSPPTRRWRWCCWSVSTWSTAWLTPNDPGCFLWSDGAGAAVLEGGNEAGFIGAAFVTVLPLPKWEISARSNYIYNFSTSRGADPPVISGFTFRNGQAGQAVWINFASSYEIAKGIRPGIDGFWQQQYTDDRTNGVSVPNALVQQFTSVPVCLGRSTKKTL
jgi:hypothetical protein